MYTGVVFPMICPTIAETDIKKKSKRGKNYRLMLCFTEFFVVAPFGVYSLGIIFHRYYAHSCKFGNIALSRICDGVGCCNPDHWAFKKDKNPEDKSVPIFIKQADRMCRG